MQFDESYAAEFTNIALGHVTREYPNALQHVMAGPDDWAAPRALHPIFYGSFDWHSCVHGYWTLARCLRRFPHRPECIDVRALFNESFTPEKVAHEIAYFKRPAAAGFERPYGWAWLLMLAAELHRHETEEGRRWTQVLQPFADFIAERFTIFLPNATYPIRAGTHANSAFALSLALDYAEVTQNERLHTAFCGKVHTWYKEDRNAQAWEPSQDDFLSPALIEVEAMRRALPPEGFREWFAGFLPRLEHGAPPALFEPALPTLRSDGKIAHLDGLNLSRAWCWRGIEHAFPAHTKLAQVAKEAADLHLKKAMPHIADNYAGSHWLQSFALLALEA